MSRHRGRKPAQPYRKGRNRPCEKCQAEPAATKGNTPKHDRPSRSAGQMVPDDTDS
jgi:hypothetical protein